MIDPNAKLIQESVTEAMRPLKDMVEITKDKVERQYTFLMVTTENIRVLKDQQSIMNGKLDKLENKIEKVDERLDDLQGSTDANTASIMEIEKTLKGYADMYKINTSNMQKLERRVRPLENKAGIIPDPNLMIVDTA